MMSIELKTIFSKMNQNLICSHLPSNDFFTKILISCFERWKRLRCSILQFRFPLQKTKTIGQKQKHRIKAQIRFYFLLLFIKSQKLLIQMV